MTYYRGRNKCVRDWQIGTYDAAAAVHVTEYVFRAPVDEGFIKAAGRSGFYRLGSIIDGHAEAVRQGRIKPPHLRSDTPAVFNFSTT